MLAGSSLIPLNNPTLWPQLPGLLSNRSAKLRYQPDYLLRHAGRLSQFVWQARAEHFAQTVKALHALISRSRQLHRTWMDWATCAHLRRDDGWLMLHRTRPGPVSAEFSLDIYRRHGIDHAVLSAAELQELEPALRPGVFESAWWIRDASAVRDPQALVQAYVRAFMQAGGHWLRGRMLRLTPHEFGWRIETNQGARLARRVVLALGPWSADALRPLGLHIPLIHERGQHVHLSPPSGPALNRPIHDTAHAYVLSPMREGYRLTTGVELNDLSRPPSSHASWQLSQAVGAVQAALNVGPVMPEPAWLGCRPTLPDSRPMIGAAGGRWPGLWLALGHQHIGLSTGPASGEMLAQLMLGEPTAVDPLPFSPTRFS